VSFSVRVDPDDLIQAVSWNLVQEATLLATQIPERHVHIVHSTYGYNLWQQPAQHSGS